MVGPTYEPPAQAAFPAAWHAPLPHGGRPLELAQWWAQFNDPLLSELVQVSQADSPSLAQARARVVQARAALDTSNAALLPSVGLNASVSRSNGTGIATAPGTSPVQTLATAALSPSWDVDLFGGTRRSVEAAAARAVSSEQDAYQARVMLAAEVADAYVTRRQCEVLMALSEVDLASRIETHRLTRNKVASGFTAPADLLRTEASVAESTSLQQSQKGACARSLNQLVALTGLPPADLEGRLQRAPGAIPVPAGAAVAAVPAALVSQRPDVASLERALAAASADIGVAIADRLPHFSLAGTIGVNRLRLGGSTVRFDTWSFSPSLSLPIFDGGRGAARVEASRAKYEEVLAAYRQRVRQAVQEVEDALVRVDVAVQRERATELAESRYQQYFEAKQVQFRVGTTSLLDLEDARRITVGSRQALAAVRLERAQSWIALYKSLGGGWQEAP